LLFPILLFVTPFLGLAAVLGFAMAAPGSQLLGRTLVRGEGTAARIALTFDDGPGEATPLILDILKKAGIRATFFLCGQNVDRFPELARRIAAEGHEIGNHTYSHPYRVWKMPGRIAWEISRTSDTIERETGCRPKLFRPPYGVRWFGLFPVLKRHELTPVMWSVSGGDWKLPAPQIAERVIARTKPGAIILLHDGVPLSEVGDRKETAKALEEIVRAFGNRYQFVTVSEIV